MFGLVAQWKAPVLGYIQHGGCVGVQPVGAAGVQTGSCVGVQCGAVGSRIVFLTELLLFLVSVDDGCCFLQCFLSLSCVCVWGSCPGVKGSAPACNTHALEHTGPRRASQVHHVPGVMHIHEPVEEDSDTQLTKGGSDGRG